MPDTYSQLYYHFVWSTKDRQPLITSDYQDKLYKCMRTLITRKGGTPLEIGGVEDHVHLLIGTPLTLYLPDFVAHIKANSSRWLRKEFPKTHDFRWQTGYSAFTVSRSCIDSVSKYIQNQEEHHKKRSFEEEIILLLEKHQVSFNKKYVFN